MRGPKRRRGAPKTIGILSDLHCGSLWGLCPPKHRSGSQMPEGSGWLWRQWLNLIREWPDLDLLILNGDLIDGRQGRSANTGILTASMGGQTKIAIDALEPVMEKAKVTIRTEGTSYHEGFDSALEALDEHFGIVKPPKSKQIFRDVELTSDFTINVKHKPEGEQTLYRGTSLDREMLWATVAEARHDIPKAELLVRSHLHHYCYMDDGHKAVMITPCWQLQSPYAQHKRQYGWRPTIGGILLEQDKLATHGYRIIPRTFKHPKVEADTYEQL